MPSVSSSHPLGRVLIRLERRRRALALCRGLGLALTLAALGGLLGIALDHAFFLPQGIRWGIWVAWLVAILAVAAIRGVRALFRTADPLALASKAERDDPASASLEALTAAISLARSPHGSPGLIAAITDRAVTLSEGIEPARILPSRLATRRLAIGTVLIGVLLAPAFLAPPGPVRNGVRRFLAPWANIERGGVFSIEVEPGNALAAIGSRPSIRVGVRGGTPARVPDEAWIEWRDVDSDGASRRMAMTGDAGRFDLTMPRLKKGLRYRAIVGEGLKDSAGPWWRFDPATTASPWYRLDAVEPPRLVELRATVQPPAYTGFPSKTTVISGEQGTMIGVWQDSGIRLEISSDRRLRSAAAALEFEDSGPGPRAIEVPGTVAADGRSSTASLAVERSGSLIVSLTDESGIVGESEVLCRVKVRVDAPPRVAIRELDREPERARRGDASAISGSGIEARPDEIVRLGISAVDDVTVASVELHHEVERSRDPDGELAGRESAASSRGTSNPPPISATAETLPGLGTPRARGELALNLQPLNLNPGDRLTYRVRVADNRPTPRGPNVTWSEPRTVTIVRRAESLAQRRREAARAAIQAQLDAVKRATAGLRREAERLRYAADAARQGSGAWDAARQRALAEREADAVDLIGEIQRLATMLETRPRPSGRPDAEADFHALAPAARDAAGREGESSREALAQARRGNDAELPEAAPRRLEALRQADSLLAELAERLDEIQRKFDATGRKGKPGSGEQGGNPSELASKEGDAKSGDGESEMGTDRAPGEGRESKEEKGGESSGNRSASAGKSKSDRSTQVGKPGAGPAAPTGYPALHEEAEPMPESGAGDLASLRDALRNRSGRAWAELPGELRSRIFRMPQVRFRDEYARQIERYYRALAEPTPSQEARADE